MTPKEMEVQRRSFAYGNVRLSNGKTTRDDIDRAAETLRAIPRVDSEGVCEDCEAMPEGKDGRAAWCKYHQNNPTIPNV